MERTPTIAVLAGGLATRLGELSKQTPKSLIDVLGRPFLAWQLELFAANGLTDVVLCIGHHGEQIERWIAEHPPAGIQVRFSRDGERALGTGGALLRALPLLGDCFLVTYGDSYLRCNYPAVYRHFLEQEARWKEAVPPLGLMTVFENDNRFDKSNVVFRDGQIVRYDKVHPSAEMRHIDWGLGVLTSGAVVDFPGDRAFDLAQVYEALVTSHQLVGLEMRQRFYEVGSLSGLEEFRQYAGSQLMLGCRGEHSYESDGGGN